MHAWAAWRVYKIEKKRRGVGDRVFLERVFQKLLLNFTWWVNRKDADGQQRLRGRLPRPRQHRRVRSLGAAADRRHPRAVGRHQLDGDVLAEPARDGDGAGAARIPAYEDVASKFWEHFLYIGHAMGHQGKDQNLDLWDDEDGFFYDCLQLPDGTRFPLKVRSMVGLIPLFAVETLEPEMLERLPGFKRRLEWFVEHRPRPDRQRRVHADAGTRRAAAAVGRHAPIGCGACCATCSTSSEFLSPYGIRALSRVSSRPSVSCCRSTAHEHRVDYEPGESSTGLFGGNSNWRGPIWFPVNYLLIESLQKFHHYFGDDFTVECPTGSGQMLTLSEVATELSRRLSRIFLRDDDGRRPVFGDVDALPARSALARLRAVPRVLPRRHRPRRRRQPSDRLDRARREAAAAERRADRADRATPHHLVKRRRFEFGTPTFSSIFLRESFRDFLTDPSAS